jgi:hypothetical protein
VAGSGCWFRFQVLVPGSKVLVPGSRVVVLGSGFWVPSSGFWPVGAVLPGLQISGAACTGDIAVKCCSNPGSPSDSIGLLIERGNPWSS